MKRNFSHQPNLHRLGYIVAVADDGRITNAAIRLRVSQPVISVDLSGG